MEYAGYKLGTTFLLPFALKRVEMHWLKNVNYPYSKKKGIKKGQFGSERVLGCDLAGTTI
jgi:hypothetical protein